MAEALGANPEIVFILAGIAVWATVITFYVYGQPYLTIRHHPDPTAIRFGPEVLLLVLIFFVFVAQLALQAVLFLRPSISPASPGLHVVGDIVAKAAATALMFAILRSSIDSCRLFPDRSDSCPTAAVRVSSWLRIPLLALATYFAIYPLVNVLILNLSVYFFHHVLRFAGPDVHQALELLNDPKTPAAIRISTILLAAVISPLAEELFFRGLVQNHLYKLFRRPWPAIVLAGFLFMATHVPLYQQMPALWVLGIILGWSYYRYQTLAMPICLHVIFNTGTLVLWWFGVR